MQTRWFRIKKLFPGLNQLYRVPLKERMRQEELYGRLAILMAREASFKISEPAFYTYLICTPDNRMDPLNVGAGTIKLIEDGLVRGGAMPGDGRKWIYGHAFFVQTTNGQASVLVAASQLRCLTLAEALELEERCT